MYLLRCKGRGFDRVQLVEDHEEAKTFGRLWVGEHHPIDGCSTKPVEAQYETRWVSSRSTSFGRREAVVYKAETGGVNGQIWDIT